LYCTHGFQWYGDPGQKKSRENERERDIKRVYKENSREREREKEREGVCGAKEEKKRQTEKT